MDLLLIIMTFRFLVELSDHFHVSTRKEATIRRDVTADIEVRFAGALQSSLNHLTFLEEVLYLHHRFLLVTRGQIGVLRSSNIGLVLQMRHLILNVLDCGLKVVEALVVRGERV